METRKYLFETKFKQFLNEQNQEISEPMKEAVQKYLDTIEQIFEWALEVVRSGTGQDRPEEVSLLDGLLARFKGESVSHGISRGIVDGVTNIDSKSIRKFTARYDMQFTGQLYSYVSKYLDEMDGKIFAGLLDSLVRAGNALLNQIAEMIDDSDSDSPAGKNWYKKSGFKAISDLDRAINKMSEYTF